MTTISDVNEAMKVPLAIKGSVVSRMNAGEVQRLSPMQTAALARRMKSLSEASTKFKEREITIVREADEMVAEIRRDNALAQLREVEAESAARRMASRAETARKMEEAAPLLTDDFMIGRVGSDDEYLNTLEDIDFEAMSKAERKTLITNAIQALIGPKKVRYVDALTSPNSRYEAVSVIVTQTPKTASIGVSEKYPDDEDFKTMDRFKKAAKKAANKLSSV